MNVQVSETGITFADLDGFRCEFLRQLPEAAAADDKAARDRIFPKPCADPDDERGMGWKEFVEPELRELFQSHIDIVAADLEAMPDRATLAIPRSHADAWIHTLNQARLALGARHNVTEEDIGEALFPADPDKLVALVQMDVYAVFLSVLLEVTE